MTSCSAWMSSERGKRQRITKATGQTFRPGSPRAHPASRYERFSHRIQIAGEFIRPAHPVKSRRFASRAFTRPTI